MEPNEDEEEDDLDRDVPRSGMNFVTIEKTKELSNFTLLFTEDIDVLDEYEQTRYFRGSLKLDDRISPFEIRIFWWK